MDKVEPKHRRKLNAEQLEVLELLRKFRFGSNDLFAQYFGKKDRSFVHKRLTILLEQGMIGKRFDSSYRIQGKPAAYYLTPTGARALQKQVNIKAIYKDKSVKDDFVRHSMDVFALYNWLKLQHGDRLKFFTKADLNQEQFGYFPQPLPDAYIRFRLGGEERQFFLDFYYDSQPFFTAVRRLKKYMEYAEGGEWEATGTSLPKLLAVCESEVLQKRLQKRSARSFTEYAGDDLIFALTTKPELKSGETTIWQLAISPDRKVTLLDEGKQALSTPVQ